MPTINQLSSADSLQAGDTFPFYSQNNGDARKVALSNVQEFMQENLNFAGREFVTQYTEPPSGDANLSVIDGSDNVHFMMRPAGNLLNVTIKLPSWSGIVDKQEIIVTCNNSIFNLTLDPNGAFSVLGYPTSLGINGFFRLKYDNKHKVWVRIG